jgi:hypothetical protein
MNAGMLLGGSGIGAGLMYALDPERGGRRRGIVRDKAVSAINKTGAVLGTTSRDVANRAAEGSSSALGASGT